MYRKIFRNNQINYGKPFDLKNNDIIFEEKPVLSDIESKQEEMVEKYQAGIIIDQAVKDAEKLLEVSKQEALLEKETIIENGKKEALKIKEKAKENGYKEGLDKVKKEYEQIMNEAMSIKEQARKEYKDLLESLEADMIILLYDVSKKIFGEEIQLNKENILKMIECNINKLSSKESLILRVSKEDYIYVKENKDKLIENISDCDDLIIRQDNSLGKNGLIIESQNGNIDASLNLQLENIKKNFLKLLA